MKADELLSRAPKCRARDIEEINALFPAYIFRRRKTGELWTTCCRRHETAPVSTIWEEPHVREPRYRYWKSDPIEKRRVSCPFCGREAKVKDLQYTGRRDNLAAYRKVVLLRFWRGRLWAVALECRKTYPDTDCLTAPPEYGLRAVYRYDADGVTMTKHHWYYGWSVPNRTDYGNFKDRTADRPFRFDAQDAYTYAVIGLDALAKTPARYVPTDRWLREQGEITALLHAAYAYPRQVEMLLKAGLYGPVTDLVFRGVRNAAVLNWSETDPRRAFKASPQEVREFLATECRDLKALALYRKLTRRGEKLTVAEAVSIYEFREHCVTIDDYLERYHLTLCRIYRYLAGLPGYRTPWIAWTAWRDYVDAAGHLDMALHRSDVLLPKKLGEAHDRTVAEWNRKQSELREQVERERLERMQGDYSEQLPKLQKRYGYAAAGYLIRVPETGEEIRREGRALEHCVGGYAERHLQGKTVILFLRRAGAPDKPWLTIEMDGAKLRQIHGWRNEGAYSAKRIAPDPRETMRWWLDPWLAWVKAGSRRKKDGTPIVPENKKGESAS